MELFGRRDKLAEVIARIRSGRRLVTVVGPGGVGKTALASAAVEELGPTFPLGAHRVDLSRIDRPDAVGGALAAQLGFASFESLAASPTDQPALLLVDNCEHVLESAGETISTLLDRCPSPTVLATSRSPLDLPGESVVTLNPLPVPAPGTATATPAVQLFCERTRDAGVEIDDGELDLVGELCRRLDGLPLALEIAAARSRSLGIADILRQLESGIRVIARPTFRGDARHRSLYETITWSYELLDAEARSAFDRLGVCAGPFTLGLAAAVAIDESSDATRTLAVVERLLAASLLVARRTPSGVRYVMLESVRAVAVEHLTSAGALAPARDRFSSHVQRVVAEWIETSRVRWDATLLPDLLDLFDSIDAALRHCVADDPEPDRAMMLYAALWGALRQGRVDEIFELGLLLRERWPAPRAPFADEADATLAMAYLLRGHPGRAAELALAALARVDENRPASSGADANRAPRVPFAAVMLRLVLGQAARAEGDRAKAADLHRDAATVAAESQMPALAAECRVLLAQDLAALGDQSQALSLVRDVATQARASGSVINEIAARTTQAAILLDLGDRAGDAVAEAALALAEEAGYPYGIVSNLQALAWSRLRAGAPADAAPLVLRVLEAFGRVGSGVTGAALELAVETLRCAGRPAWADLAAAVGDPGQEAAASLVGGRPGSHTDAVRLAGRELAALAASPPARTSAPARPPRRRGFDTAADRTGRLRRTGDVWEITFGGDTVHVKDAKGMRDLAALLRRPGQETHCLDLAGAAVVESSAGETIDAEARRSYERRVRELQAEIEQAEIDNDPGRADASRLELDELVDHLTAALGLGKRARHQGGTTARARSAVTHRLRAAVRRIAQVHPELGRHLDRSVQTGVYCSYVPEPAVTWQVDERDG